MIKKRKTHRWILVETGTYCAGTEGIGPPRSRNFGDFTKARKYRPQCSGSTENWGGGEGEIVSLALENTADMGGGTQKKKFGREEDSSKKKHIDTLLGGVENLNGESVSTNGSHATVHHRSAPRKTGAFVRSVWSGMGFACGFVAY